MRRWVPRRPSAKLRTRLFPHAAASAPNPADALWWRWLAPATAALVLSMFIAAERGGPGAHLSARVTNALLADSSAARQWVAYQTAERHSFRNAVPDASLGWTNEAASTSSMPSFPLLRTNYMTP
ncbi:MAG: hypothetical protein HYY24_17400 [Verrucomicrobia bacterium]|nr:hypothetical protein [Verrucomicrobiota bacterium]